MNQQIDQSHEILNTSSFKFTDILQTHLDYDAPNITTSRLANLRCLLDYHSLLENIYFIKKKLRY